MSPKMQALRTLFEVHADANEAQAMQAYMKDIAPFLGIKAPIRRSLFKGFLKQNTPPQYLEALNWAQEMWAQPEREFHYCAIELVETTKKHWQPDTIQLFETYIISQSWWDTVDFMSTHLVGVFFQKYPHLVRPITEKWMASDNFWLQRVCLLFQLAYKQNTDADLLFDYCRRLAGEKEFFIRKAIGWALRQHAKFDAEAVKNFVEKTDLSPLSKREALKHF
jgi:3-methyladenine DNA glycosylase AlkD